MPQPQAADTDTAVLATAPLLLAPLPRGLLQEIKRKRHSLLQLQLLLPRGNHQEHTQRVLREVKKLAPKVTQLTLNTQLHRLRQLYSQPLLRVPQPGKEQPLRLRQLGNRVV